MSSEDEMTHRHAWSTGPPFDSHPHWSRCQTRDITTISSLTRPLYDSHAHWSYQTRGITGIDSCEWTAGSKGEQCQRASAANSCYFLGKAFTTSAVDNCATNAESLGAIMRTAITSLNSDVVTAVDTYIRDEITSDRPSAGITNFVLGGTA